MLVPYESRSLFVAHHQKKAVTLPSAVEGHIQDIERTLTTKHYIETGWPMYGALPSLLKRFKGRVKLVQVVRHPIWMAGSLARHKFYQNGEITKSLALTPTDQGVVQAKVAGPRWDSMPEFEKNLFWWGEQHSLGIATRELNPDVPSMTLRFEDMFSIDAATAIETLETLLQFLRLPIREQYFESRSSRVDKYSEYRAEDEFDLQNVELSPTVKLLAQQFDYNIDLSIGSKLRRKYRTSLLEKILSGIRRGVKRVLQIQE